LWIWCAAYAWYVLGFWSRSLEAGPFDALAWVVPLIGFSLACLFHAMDIAARLRDPAHRVPWLGLVFSMCMTIALTGIGFALTKMEPPDKDAIWVQLLGPWQKLDAMVIAAMAVFLTAMVMMMLGFATRFATIVTWMLSMSFANSNPYLDNAGDTIRSILLFYLIFCPCGAAWSIDALIARRKGRVYVPPWPIQLMLIQMCFIYLMNGMYKLLGASWVEGFSMHYVLGDLVLTRFSPMMVPLPPQLAKLMTWSVVAWEVSFPVLVIWKWPRRVALLLGAMFHLGIFATLELGGFVPYALCMYLPFLPWGGWERAEELNTLK